MSCKNKAADPIFDTFDHFVSQSDKVIIDFKDSNKKDSIISLSEIKKIRGIIKESKKSEDCYFPSGTIRFYNNGNECGFIEFGLNKNCPSFYLFFEGMPSTYRMSYRGGMYLDQLQNESY